MAKRKISSLDKLGYYLLVISTLGYAWALKCIIVKALNDFEVGE